MHRVLALLLLAGCAFRTPWQEQRVAADALKPAEVSPAAHAPAGAVRVLRVRAYADADYQAQTPRWTHHIEEQLDRASAALTAQFGVRLELESARPWNRSGASARLEPLVEQLFALDKGDGVDWVAGFVSSLDVFSAAQDQLGVAGLFGRHLVLRGISSAAEMDAINQSLQLLSTGDREQLVRERRLHKEISVFLHEWAHTLGAIHDRSPQTFMAPAYDKSQASFSEASARIIGIGLSFRDSPGSREAWARAYREELARDPGSFWDAAERERSLASADRFFASGPEKAPAEALAPEDAKQLELALRREKAGDFARAMLLVEPLASRYPRSAAVQNLACTLEEESGRPQALQLAACGRAADLPGAPAHVLLVAAQLRLASQDPRGALPLLRRVEPILPADPKAWLWLAQLQLAAGALQAAERAAGHAPGEKGMDQVLAECARTRRFIGFPKEPLAADREAAYVAAALAAHEQIDLRKPQAALERAAQMAREFPGTPAAAVIECRARSRESALAPIDSACTAAARADPGAFLPRYILGLVAIARGRWAEADAALRRALEIDGSTPEVWASLAAVQERLRARSALRELKAAYAARFGRALVPALFPAGWIARPR